MPLRGKAWRGLRSKGAYRDWGKDPDEQAERLFFLRKNAGFVEEKEYAATAFDRLRGESVLYYGQAPEEIPKGTFSGQFEEYSQKASAIRAKGRLKDAVLF